MKPTGWSFRQSQAGLSLIELMIAILISSFLLLGVLTLFLNSLQSDRSNSELSRVQEAGRLAMEVISREVRRTGYQGCRSAALNIPANGTVHPAFPDFALQSGSARSFTVHYARAGAGNFPHRDCDNGLMDPFQVTFSNCGPDLCLNSTDSAGDQVLTANTQISNLLYGVQDGNRLRWLPYGAMTAPDWPKVHKLQVSLDVRAANDAGFQPRTFTSIIELRNRL